MQMAQTRASKFTLTLVLFALAGASACGDESSGDSNTAGTGVAAAPAISGGIGGGVVAPPAGGATTPVAGVTGGVTPGGSAAGTTATAGATAGAAGATAGSAGGQAGATTTAGSSGGAGTPAAVPTEKFSFFVASYAAMMRLSKSEAGFGGDLRYGESDGLKGADKICTEIAETSMKGAGAKGWRSFLCVTTAPDGTRVHAIDRVGAGPWYDRRGRLLAMTKTDLLTTRPTGADPAIINDFPNEDGVPNQAPDGELVDNHDILTGTDDKGQLFSTDWGFTCHDWTTTEGRAGTPRVGHSWPRMGGPWGFPTGGSGGRGGFPPPGGFGGSGGLPSGIGDLRNWMSALNEAGCAPGAMLIENGPPDPEIPTVGSGGGYGGIYCFALMP